MNVIGTLLSMSVFATLHMHCMDIEQVAEAKLFDAFPIITEYNKQAQVIIHSEMQKNAKTQSGLLKTLPHPDQAVILWIKKFGPALFKSDDSNNTNE